MCRGVIQHSTYVTDYLRRQIRRRELETPIGMGRIYRVVHESTRRGERPRLREKSEEELVEVLSHPNGWWRDTAQRLIVERGDTTVAPDLRELLATAGDERVRLHALWTLDGLGVLRAETLLPVLADSSAQVRAAALRIAEPWLEKKESAVRSAVMERMDDDAPPVRRQLAASLGELSRPQRSEALTDVLVRHSAESAVVDAVISGQHGQELDFLRELLAEDRSLEGVAGRAEVVKWLSAAVLNRESAPERQQLFAWIGQADRPRWQRLALLEGMETFAPPAGQDDVQPLALEERPKGLLAAQSASDSLVQARAQSLVDRFRWPGKPVPEPQSALPLTAAQQEQFERGKEKYKSTCAVCHGSDGRGQVEGAARLVGSDWVTGEPELAARILLQSKEGNHLMPPVGQQMSDATLPTISRDPPRLGKSSLGGRLDPRGEGAQRDEKADSTVDGRGAP